MSVHDSLGMPAAFRARFIICSCRNVVYEARARLPWGRGTGTQQLVIPVPGGTRTGCAAVRLVAAAAGARHDRRQRRPRAMRQSLGAVQQSLQINCVHAIECRCSTAVCVSRRASTVAVAVLDLLRHRAYTAAVAVSVIDLLILMVMFCSCCSQNPTRDLLLDGANVAEAVPAHQRGRPTRRVQGAHKGRLAEQHLLFCQVLLGRARLALSWSTGHRYNPIAP